MTPLDWRRINREQAEQGLPADLRDEDGNLFAPRPKVVTCPGCEGMSTLKGQPDCEMCGNTGVLPIADFDKWLADNERTDA